MAEHTVVIVGGTHGLGNDLARHYVEAGRRVIVTGRDAERAEKAAAELGDTAEGLADLSEPRRSRPPSPASARSTGSSSRRSNAT